MRRTAAMLAVALLLPAVAWRAVAAAPPPPEPPPAEPSPPAGAPQPDDTTTTTTTVPPAPVPAAPPIDTTTTTSTTTTTTIVDPAATTTTTLVDPAATSTTIVDPAATTTTPVDPPAETTVPVEDPNATTTTTMPAETTDTTPPAPETTVPEELLTDPVVAPPESEGGRVFLPSPVAETGQVRPITFPVAGPVSYWNDFGACRDGCNRSHKGNDIIGDRLQPLLAMRDGFIDRLINHPTAGYGIVVQDADGWEYHIYHVNNDSPGTDDGADDGSWRFAEGIAPGRTVTAGQVIAWMGDSGNSEGSVPHAHVEIHTPSGAAINPFWSLRLAQRDVNCAIQTIPAPAGPIGLVAPPADPAATFLADGWSAPELLDALPGDWQPLTLTGGEPGSGRLAARMWIGPTGYTPVDAAAVRVGDPRFDEDCTQPTTVSAPAAIPAELGAILATIRAMETGGNYTTQVTSSTASGAYGFLDSSWGGYGGYARARDAPPPVQDAKAAELATYILSRNAGDVSTIPVSWYIGHVPRGSEWDTVPTVGNNKLTPREYQTRWLNMYARVLGQPDAWVTSAPQWTAVDTSVTCHTVVVDLGPPGEAQYALTLAQRFATDAAGRAVLSGPDPCDPQRPVLEVAAEAPPTLRPDGPS